ncbi:MAG TPA: crosslink repair DNA glycosylase YcaQ family protein [Candidatus Limnocylindrales bacterium]|nr:crosslink repair DNA glycosylase YcaQ family protein [Candidatus Limnocylindrales bacterium]
MPPQPPRISAPAARRIALAAQGFADARPAGGVGRRHLRRLVDGIGLIQIDSVNTLVRAHELPAFARLGPYPRTLIKESTERHRELFEYWGHAACLMPIATHPLWRWRMERMRDREWRRWVDRIQRERPGYLDVVLAEVRDRGPMSAGELSDGGSATGRWWGWADGKVALEFLFGAGELSVAGRRNTFERAYDLTERVVPRAILAMPTPSIEDAHRELVRIVSRALGVATRRDISNYLYLRADRTTAAITELVEEGDLLPVTVDGWSEPAFLAAGARRPRRVDARALLAPFDPLVFDRDRVERLFGMRYRIEIYTPAPKRVYGYYVLPFLLGDNLVGRIDLKADRPRSTLLVQAAHGEPGVDVPAVATALADELRVMAGWLELDQIEARPVGGLAPALAAAL